MQPALPESFLRYLPPWPLDRNVEEKRFFETTQRVCDPQETWRRFGGFREKAGITRLSDITYLDCIGVPTYQVVRPTVDHYLENISVYNGKGLTKLQAKVSAMMEAFERFSGELHERPLLLSSLSRLSAEARTISPQHLILPEGESVHDEEPLEWVPGWDMMREEITWVPACQAFCPYRPVHGGRFIPNFSNTNGLASGNTYGEAITHALYELIERDAESTSWAARAAETIDLDSVHHPSLRDLIGKFEAAGICLTLKEVTSDIGIPVFMAAADEPATEDPVLLCYGMGCHLDPSIAAMRAITEVAQSRCAVISGLRGDLDELEWKRGLGYWELKRKFSFWFEPDSQKKDFRAVTSAARRNFVDDVGEILSRLRGRGFSSAVAVDLTHPELPVPVVRAVVPAMEQSLESRRKGLRFKFPNR